MNRPPVASPTEELLRRYDRPGPRYTSYPTANEFHDDFTEADYRERLARANARGEEPLSLYAHLPFCEQRCLYCACNVVITPHRDVAIPYLDHLALEIDLLARHLPNRRVVSQLHWGGGTPTYYRPEQLERLFESFRRHFTFTPDAEIALEVDPRVTTGEHIRALRRLGFNRLSMGVQDFAPEVQQAVHRVQSVAETRSLIELAREEGYASINLDLIYGLPYQTRDGFRRTLDHVLALRPDRLAVYSFAFVPWIQAHMKHLPAESLPGASLKLELLALTIDVLSGAGYRHIGMDHFALPGDELARAIDARTLHRNFMGYTVQSARDLIGVGVSAIGHVQDAYAQNTKKLPVNYDAVRAGRFPVERGVALDADDRVRAHVITTLMCNGRLDVRDVEARFALDFAATFAPELEALTGPDSPVAHGLLVVSEEALEVTPAGRRFIRNVCMAFDRYLRSKTAPARPTFSRTV